MDFALGRGLSMAAILRGTDLRGGQLRDPDSEVTYAQQVAVMRNIVRGIRDEPGFGLMAGLTCHPPMLDALELAVMSQPSVGRAFEIGIRFAEQSCSLARHTLEQHGDEMELVRDDSMVPADIRRFSLEHDIGVLVGMQRDALQMRQAVKRAEVTVEDNPVYEGIAVVLGVRDVTFGSSRTVLFLDTELMNAPMPQANPRFARLYSVQSDGSLRMRRSRHRFGRGPARG
ncbi:hypothetical protein GPX89_06265 [Nocardia sp. ET3-3]|uniref:HTH-type transcriptional regulator AraC-type N-terminal domain-containing protein n=1 Tax=Nocardia terrae TaxID=2675851 RepID=A0A7K1UR74_9NOCA|nr:AraC family transcriptional regulator ligand-binding domain-containing protein [Nocardia terrae]MVU76850.1 hypothetical protein [Nocardia terrae]